MRKKLLKSTAERRQHRTTRLIARHIKARRVQLGMRRITLANRMAMTERQILRWESGDCRVSCGALAMIAETFGNMPGDFFVKDFPTD